MHQGSIQKHRFCQGKMDFLFVRLCIWLISILSSVNLAMCWILRLPCKTEANFTISAVGYALEHNVLMKLTLPLDECRENCIYTAYCKSFNYKQSGLENCELNSETNVTKPTNLVQKSNWTYFATNQFTRAIGSLCQKLRPCSAQQFCIDDCACPGYRCVSCAQAYEASFGWFDSSKFQPSCKSIQASGITTSGSYSLDGIGNHYCMMGGDCGPGGWTLAMKLDGETDTFKAASAFWANEDLYNSTSTDLNDGNAKFNAFSRIGFDYVCIGMKSKGDAIENIKWLKIPKSSCSLFEIFAPGESSFTNIAIQKWKVLVPQNGNPLQGNCNRQGFNIKRDNQQNIFARIGIMGNNENECISPDSGIGVGLDGRIGATYSGTAYAKIQAYIFIQ
ncbi:uncharacterized protein LOC135695109 isoform X2 [Rhopilema esculentum]|uniref:uncharacterized protein LOC135695109 isoform X2 n=1 Tax=Rhopilema esculentum TaxID=499914 RepID=UPI0031DABB8A